MVQLLESLVTDPKNISHDSTKDLLTWIHQVSTRSLQKEISYRSNAYLIVIELVYMILLMLPWNHFKSWIVKICLVCEDVISFEIDLLHYNARQSITLLKVHGDVISWLRVTRESTNIGPPQALMIPQ